MSGVLLLLGVTFLSFLLMVYYAPDQTYQRLGKNPRAEDVESLRRELCYDCPFIVRYAGYLHELATFDFGHSYSSGERVSGLLARTVPVSLALLLPGFVLGNALGLLLAMLAAHYPRALAGPCGDGGLGGGHERELRDRADRLPGGVLVQLRPRSVPRARLGRARFRRLSRYVTVPTLATMFVTLGYNTRFYRAVLVEELGRDHVRTARAFGASETQVLALEVLPNAAVPIVTRLVYSIPLVVIGGSLLIESYFGIPGIGKATYEAIGAGDLPVLKAVVGLTPVLFVLALLVADLLTHALDPRLELR